MMDTLITSSGQLPHKLFLIGKWAFAGDHFKILMETGKIIKTAFVAKLFYTQIIFNQQFAGVSHPKLNQKLRIGFSCSGFKIPAERIRTDVSHPGYFFQLDGTFEIFHTVFVYSIDAVFFIIYKVILKTNRG